LSEVPSEVNLKRILGEMITKPSSQEAL